MIFNFSKCEYCQKPFSTARGLQNHQSRDTTKNFGCHRLQVLRERVATQKENRERKENLRQVRLQEHHENVSLGLIREDLPLPLRKNAAY